MTTRRGTGLVVDRPARRGLVSYKLVGPSIQLRRTALYGRSHSQRCGAGPPQRYASRGGFLVGRSGLPRHFSEAARQSHLARRGPGRTQGRKSRHRLRSLWRLTRAQRHPGQKLRGRRHRRRGARVVAGALRARQRRRVDRASTTPCARASSRGPGTAFSRSTSLSCPAARWWSLRIASRTNCCEPSRSSRSPTPGGRSEPDPRGCVCPRGLGQFRRACGSTTTTTPTSTAWPRWPALRPRSWSSIRSWSIVRERTSDESRVAAVRAIYDQIKMRHGAARRGQHDRVRGVHQSPAGRTCARASSSRR